MIEARLQRVFDAMDQHGVAFLLMGGQACVLYGAAEFSKDIDFVILADQSNLDKVDKALQSLDAEIIAVPPFESQYLEAGLAVHFRCKAAGMNNLRVDVMTKMRGVEPFSDLWTRRRVIYGPEGSSINLLGVRDLVAAKKTQRDKDWPMIQRLLEVIYLQSPAGPKDDEVEFWLRELRTAELLLEVTKRFPANAVSVAKDRVLIHAAIEGNIPKLNRALMEEMLAEKEKDRVYWLPLKKMLEELRANNRDNT